MRWGFVGLTLCVLGTAFWWWGGRTTSLQNVLELAHTVLPQSQRLAFERVSGSLWRGGTIAQLRWSDGALQIEVNDLEVQWDLSNLLQRKLVVPRLSMALLRVDDQRPSTPLVVPGDAQLPLELDVHWSVGALHWGPSAHTRAQQLSGHYAYDGLQHRVEVHQANLASGSYRVTANVQAQSPMALQAALSGVVQTQATPTSKPLQVDVTANVSGALGAIDASLALQVRLRPQSPGVARDAMQADLQAHIVPWRAPWVTAAKAQWRSLDLAALWPQAPATLLDGSAEVAPALAGWQASVSSANRRSGPLTQQLLPIQQLNARVGLQAGEWRVEQFRARVGVGYIEGHGRLRAGSDWEGSASVMGIDPAAMDPRWEAVGVDGELAARQTSVGIQFDAQLHARAQATRTRVDRSTPSLLFRQLQVQGVWAEPALRIDNLHLALSDAQLRGKAQIDTRQWSGSGSVEGAMAGAQWHAAGDLSAASGRGDVQITVLDAQKVLAWMQWFGVGTSGWGNRSVQGGLRATAHWSGGWKDFGEHMEVQARVDVPELRWGSNQEGQPPWHLKDLRAALDGRPSAMAWTLFGRAEHNALLYGLKSSGKLARVAAGHWDGQLQTFELSASSPGAASAWMLQMDNSTDVRWMSDFSVQSLLVAQGSARLSGPVTGVVRIAWKPAQWSRRALVTNGVVNASTQWRSQGEVSELPLQWLTHIAGHRGLQQGLVGDLAFGGSWVASGRDQELQLHADVKRARGDLQVNADDANPNLEAGVRDAQMSLHVNSDAVHVQALWDSANAGTLQASASTRLNYTSEGWSWPLQAPLRGQLRANLPRLGGWSILAPPGWRLRGTLDARADLSGSRQTPVWSGTLSAKELSVRSVVDGIDFSNGTMRLNLTGDGLEIADFSLQGARGAGTSGGTLTLAGAVRWPGGATATHGAQWHMDVQATAKALRVSARADQRLVVSGSLGAHLDAHRLVIEGSLAADQGVVTLAQDATPRLDSDVRIVKGSTVDGGARMHSTRGGFVLAQSIEPRVHIALDLGPRFQVEGYGLNARLAGKVVLSTVTQNLLPRLHGEIQTVNGTYRAYGQQLNIEEGVLRFAGAFDNPGLDILAIRPNLSQRVGVQILGTALAPSVRLYADPELPDAEKLSWLVVGRANADGSAQMALVQQAAIAAMSRSGQPWSASLANDLGLDEISLSGLGTNSDSAGGAGATLRIGKRIAGNFYVAYERSVAGAYGTFAIFYDLSKHLTLRGQTGQHSAADLIYTTRYD